MPDELIHMTHPDLPGQELDVRPAKARVLKGNGWVATPTNTSAPGADEEPPELGGDDNQEGDL